MHRIFCIPELLDEIFSYSSRHTNTVVARVCRIWFTQSIPFIWDHANLHNALSVLSPFAATNLKSEAGFQDPLVPGAWLRFFLYSKHVRSLDCLNVNRAALSQATLWRPSGTELFSSKLTILNWTGYGLGDGLDCLPPLLSPSLRILFISMGSPLAVIDPCRVDVLCQTIAFRSPLLRAFSITIRPMSQYTPTSQVCRSFCGLITLLSELVAICMPVYFIDSELLMILSHLPRLEIIFFVYKPSLDMSRAKKLLKRSVAADEDLKENIPFRSLNHLSTVEASSHPTFTIAKFFDQKIQMFALKTLTCSPQFTSRRQTIAFMESVHIVCPNLRTMTLNGSHSPSLLPWPAIEPMLQCLKLHTLKIYQWDIDIELDNIITVAKNRIFWRTIALPSAGPFSFQALFAFAQNCPQLVELSFLLDIEREIPEIIETDVWFRSLTTLKVGHSTVTSPVAVGIFLSGICANSLKIEAFGTSNSLWKEVENMVNSINKTARVRILSKKIESLQESVSSMVRVRKTSFKKEELKSSSK